MRMRSLTCVIAFCLLLVGCDDGGGSVSFCVQNRLRAKSGHGKRLIDEIDLLTKEQSHDHPNQA